MQVNDLISVIVPVYNVEQYLDRCVRSIVGQTYKNLEIILVDDGSTDSSGRLCDKWAQKDSRIKVIHKSNGGLSDARNAGMATATGEYIAFVDSDDWVEIGMFRSLYKAMINTDSDIASCGAKRVWPDGIREQDLCAVNKDSVLDREGAMKALITADGLVQTVWNKLYRKMVIDDILFPVGVIHEDEFWSWKVLSKANRVVTVKESYYNYLQRDNSIMGAGFSEKRVQLVIQAKIELQSYLEEFMPALKNTGRVSLAYTCMDLGVQVLKQMPHNTANKYLKQLKYTTKNYSLNWKYLRTLPRKRRLHLYLIQHFFVPVCWLHSF